jgi:chemotaxis protein CheD
MNILEQGKVIVLDHLAPIQTVLGSCVSVCIRDMKAQVCGMNHFALPLPLSSDVTLPERYGIHAMEVLLNDLYKLGATVSNLEVSYAGGSNVNSNMSKIGWTNIGFIEDFLQTEGLCVRHRLIGGSSARKLTYDASSGELLCEYLGGYDESPISIPSFNASVELFK